MSFIIQPFKYAPPVTRVWRTTEQDIGVSTWTPVSFNTTPVEDDVNGFNPTFPTKITIPAGYTKAKVSSYVNWSYVNGGVRAARVDVNGTTYSLDVKVGLFETGNQINTDWINVNAGDIFELLAYTDSAVSRVQGTGFGGSSRLQLEYSAN